MVRWAPDRHGGFAGVWADSRYWEQATKELKGSGIELVKLQPGQPGPLGGWPSKPLRVA